MTKNANKALLTLYKAYHDKLKTMSSSDAREFSDEEMDALFADMNQRDAQAALSELKSENYIKLYIIGSCDLQPRGIEYGETLLQRGVEKFVDGVEKVVSIIKP
jgi:hypothetical protein